MNGNITEYSTPIITIISLTTKYFLTKQQEHRLQGNKRKYQRYEQNHCSYRWYFMPFPYRRSINDLIKVKHTNINDLQ